MIQGKQSIRLRNGQGSITNKTVGTHTEITGQKQDEEALHYSEARFRSVFQISPTGLCIMKDRVFQIANRAWYDCIGFSEAEIIGHTPRMLYESDEEYDRVGHELFSNLLEKGMATVQTRLRRKDGAIRDVVLTAAPLQADDLSACTVIAVEDITERKRAEEDLRVSQRQLADIINFLPDATLVIDKQGKVIAWNKAIEAMTGIRAQDMLGKGDYEYALPFYGKRRPIVVDLALHPAPEMNEHYTTIQGSGDTLFGESYVTHLPSGHAHLSATASVLRDAKGEIVAAIECIRDRTEHKLAEKALMEKEERLRLTLDAAHAVAWEINPVTGTHYEEGPVDRIFGRAKGFLHPTVRDFEASIHPDDRDRVMSALRTALRGEGNYEVEYRVPQEDGGVHWLFANGTLLRDAEGRPARMLGIARDITDRKQAEEEKRRLEERLVRAEKMEALGMLAGGVAHDLNNVLGILVGYSELLAEDIDKESPLRPHVEYIKQGCERAAAIVQDLLTLARRGVQTREIVDLNSIIDEFLNSPEFQKICSFHPNVSIETTLASRLLNIKGSPVHLRKTIMNLISNAAEAMPAGGQLVLSTNNQYLDRPIPGYDEIREGDYVVLTVSDTGGGISEKDLKKIFEPFYTRKAMGRSGTGLGLSVVWGTVKDHKGYVNVQSEEGEGTMFTIYFPVTREEAPREGRSIPLAAYLGDGESILVVDDVPGQRDLAVRMLKKLNYEVVTVPCGEEALEYLKKNKVDLVVLDMIMDPGMDGLDTYKKILEIQPKQKAIIVSGFSESDRVRQAQELGAGAYIKKPYVQEQLGLSVRKELERSA